MFIDAVFDGDYESAIILGENIYIKNENRKIRVHSVIVIRDISIISIIS
jgi:hypothetical protein